MKPLPLADKDTAPYWDAASRNELVSQWCENCGKIHFPPKPGCPYCLRTELAWKRLSGQGQVYSFCIARTNLVNGFEAPYVVAEVIPEEAPECKLIANIVECAIDDVYIGMRVEVVFEQRTTDVTLPQFKPCEPNRAA